MIWKEFGTYKVGAKVSKSIKEIIAFRKSLFTGTIGKTLLRNWLSLSCGRLKGMKKWIHLRVSFQETMPLRHLLEYCHLEKGFPSAPPPPSSQSLLQQLSFKGGMVATWASGRPCCYPDADFAGMQDTRVMGSWRYPSDFKGEPGSPGSVCSTIGILMRSLWEDGSEADHENGDLTS